MSWLFGGGKPKSPRNSEQANEADVKKQRLAQLAALERDVPGIVKRNADGGLYEMPLHLGAGGQTATLRIFLPVKFPVERPVLQLLNPVEHPWVNKYMQVVGHPDLALWRGNAGKPISAIVLEVIQEFRNLGTSAAMQAGQPAPLGQQSAAIAASQRFVGGSQPQQWQQQQQQQPSGGGWSQGPGGSAGPQMGIQHQQSGRFWGPGPPGGPQGGSPRGQGGWPSPGNSVASEGKQQEVKQRTPMPSIPSSFEEMEGLSVAQLQRLSSDNVARLALAEGMASVRGMRELLRELCKGNADVAQANLGRSQQLDELRDEIAVLKMQLKDIKTSFEAEAAALNPAGVGASASADHVTLKVVKEAAKASDKRSEAVAEAFLGGQASTGEFLEQFMAERQRYHRCAAKIECIKRTMHF